MPTPASNPPTGPSPPPPYSSSTCPDDSQSPSRPIRQVAHSDSMEVQHERRPIDPSLPFPDHPARDGPSEDDALLSERPTSAEPSSRATTMSPRPQSGITVSASPASSAPDPEQVKNPELVLGCDLSREDSLKSQRLEDRNAGPPSRESEPYNNYSDEDEYSLPSMGPEYSSMRSFAVSPSSYLRPGSRFHGTQQSERQVYDVQVEIKHVDMRESFLCGYLRIQGLTEDHPTLTTYFEGEIIGTKHSFFTQHDDWGANMKVDLSHWAKFSAFRPFQKHARKGPITIPDVAQKENIFMRWKEHFLVPDHRVRTISGASFEGFYYICFNQIKGEVSGIYFHSKSEKFQQLELKHVPDWGCFSATEFR